jgi:LuxR family transcriptional regulator, maltose regulon positive regulatory protein
MGCSTAYRVQGIRLLGDGGCLPQCRLESVGGAEAKAGKRPARRLHALSSAPEPSLGLTEAKTSRPWTRPGIVTRTSLLRRLRASKLPIVSVVAPAGFGKTTLLGQWAEKDERLFAWLSIDKGDNDPALLVRYIAASMHRLEPVGADAFKALTFPGEPILATVVPRLGSAFSSMGRRFVLVLDDVHNLNGHNSLDVVEALTRYIPNGSALALVSRDEKPIPVGRLRGQGQILEIDAKDLAMDDREASQLLRQVGVRPSEAEVLKLREWTEGWPVALYLAAVNMKTGAIEDLAAFHGSDRIMADYLRSEFLSRLPRKQVTFMRRTAVLEHMTGALCDAILKSTGAARTLESLERSSLLVVPLDRTREWYRYHHLLREMLLADLQHHEPERLPELNRMAADWCEHNGQPEAAIRYAQAAGDAERVAELVTSNASSFWHTGRAVTVEGWLDWLERNGTIERHGPVAVVGAWHHALNGQPAEAERLANAAAASSYEGPLPDGSSSLEPWVRLLRAGFLSEGVERMRQDAEAALRTMATGSVWRPPALVMLGIGEALLGNVEEAEKVFADAAEMGEIHGAADDAVVAYAERARLAIERGGWEEAQAYIEQASTVRRRFRLEHYTSSALAYAIAARLAARRGETARAREELARAHRLRPRLNYALPYFAIRPLLEMARAHIALSDAAGARTLLRDVEGVLRRRPALGALAAEADALRKQLQTIRVETPGASTLTTAELRLLPYLPSHLSFRGIGERLFISQHTVKSQAISIYRKLGVTSRGDAVGRAQDLGLLDP